MLFRLNKIRVVIIDITIDAKYSDEVSGLRIAKIVFDFQFKYLRNFFLI